MNSPPPAMRLLAAYAMMVGLPVAGISVALEAGRDLRAPVAVWGEWTMVLSTAPANCAASTRAVRSETIAIEQSGDGITVRSEDASRPRLVGRLRWADSTALSIEAVAAQRSPDGTSASVIGFQGDLDVGEPMLLRGTISRVECGRLVAIPFTATRHRRAAVAGASEGAH